LNNITRNEARVVDFLVRNFKERNSINQIGKRLGLSPNGIYKILKKLEKINAVKSERIGNAIYYSVCLNDAFGKGLAEFILVQNDLSTYAEVQSENLLPLKGIALSCILFGSAVKKGRESKDIDVLLIIEKRDYNKVRKKIQEIQELNPKRIHDIIMVKGDLAKNLKKNNDAMIDMLKHGWVLWGPEIIVEEIKNGSS